MNLKKMDMKHKKKATDIFWLKGVDNRWACKSLERNRGW